MQYVLVAVVVAGFSFIYGRVWLRRRRGAPEKRAPFEATRLTVRLPGGADKFIEPVAGQPGRSLSST